MNSRFYISTGSKECFYTLRQSFDEVVYFKTEAGTDSRVERRDYHLRNLSTDRDEAIAKAREITGLGLEADFEVREINRSLAPIDYSILQGGKYQGRGIAELAATPEGRNYLVWLVENCANSRTYGPTVELARAYIAHDLEAKAAEQAAKAAAQREEAHKQAKVFGRDFCEAHKGDVGFLGSVIRDWLAGRPCSPRALSILVDIAAKAHGRRGSKAYLARAFELDAALGL